MTATVAPYEVTALPTGSRPAPPEKLEGNGAVWWAGAPTTRVERADLFGWYQRALTADAGTPGIHVLQLPVRRLSPSEHADAQSLSGHPLDGTETWAGPTWSALVKADRRVVTHTGVLFRVIQVGDLRVPVGGLTGVATLAAWRGRGYARAAVAKVAAFVGLELWAPFVVAICPQPDTAFYESIGWRIAEAPVWCEQPGGHGPLAGHAVAYLPSQGAAAWPDGRIDLCGLPW